MSRRLSCVVLPTMTFGPHLSHVLVAAGADIE
jgi:hypothetical protein